MPGCVFQYRIISIYDQGGSSLINPTALMLHIPLLRPGNPLRAPADATTAQTMVSAACRRRLSLVAFSHR